MGERDDSGLGLEFNGSVRVHGRGHHITADSGALLLRELDDHLDLTAGIAAHLEDKRSGARFSIQELLRLRLYPYALGYGMQSDVDHLRDDPALRLAVSDSRGLAPLGRALASQPTVSRFMRMLSSPEGLQALEQGLVDSAIAGSRRRSRASRRILDIDSLPIDAHGVQGGSSYNGYYRCRCFHPLVVMDGSGHLLAARLRPGNLNSSGGATELLSEVIDRLNEAGESVLRVRGDAGFPSEELLSCLEQRKVGYAFRLSNTTKLDQMAEPHLVRPPGRRPKKPREWTYVLRYQTRTWSRERRVVLVVQEKPDELFLHYFFLVTSDETTTSGQVLSFYRQRGTMEGRLGEWVNTIAVALSSSHRDGRAAAPDDQTPFHVNAATFLLGAIAYNLLHTLRLQGARSRLSQIGRALGLARARRLLLSVCGRLIVSARRASLLVPAATAKMWAALLARLRRLKPSPIPA